MSELQDLKAAIRKLPKRESVEALQARLRLAGFEENLSAVPTREVSETFVALMTSLLKRLEKGLGSISVDEIRKTTAEVKRAKAALEPKSTAKVTAETILQGFRRYDDRVIELTLPKRLEKLAFKKGTTAIQLAGKLLNAAAKEEKGMENPVFHKRDAEFWAKNEANPSLQTKPGCTYRFDILEIRSFDRAGYERISERIRRDGVGAPLGAIAIAEACVRLKTKNKGTLFKDLFGNKVGVRGSAPGVALYSNAKLGVYVFFDDLSRADVAIALSKSNRN